MTNPTMFVIKAGTRFWTGDNTRPLTGHLSGAKGFILERKADSERKRLGLDYAEIVKVGVMA